MTFWDIEKGMPKLPKERQIHFEYIVMDFINYGE